MEKILTVSIAAYNVEETLEEALQPFVTCSCKEALDILIIDDGSKDRTAEIAAKYEAEDQDVFRLVRKENGGWGSTLNTGMKLARGRYFKQLDGDDYFSKENLDGYLAFLKGCSADLIYTPFLTFDDHTGAVLRELGRYDRQLLPERKTLYLSEVTDFVPAMHTMTVRTEILRRHPVHITEHCFYTDVEFVLKCCNFCRTMIYYELPVYYYRLARSGQSMSVEGIRRHYQDHLKMLYTMLAYEKRCVKETHVRRIFRERLSGVCDMQYKFFFALRPLGSVKKEVRQYDTILKKQYPYYYERTNGKTMRLLRGVHFVGYRFLAAAADRIYQRAKAGVYEG